MEHLADRTTLEMNLGEVRIGDRSGLAGRSLGETSLRAAYGVTVVAVKRENGKMLFNPGPEEQLGSGDTLVVIGHEKKVAAAKRALKD